jgi:two-component system, cell cycle sensor histidine kinase and response regulator CckA
MTETLHVLIVEDSATDAKLLLRELQRVDRPIEFERVETSAAMREALARRPWDIIISDWSMPKFSGRAALELVKELRVDLPFIIVSGTVGEERAVAAMRAGARDFVLKDKLSRLAPAIEREIREHETRKAHVQADLARREADLRFRRIFESGITGVTYANTSGIITDANDTFLEMVGYTRDDLRAGALNWMEMTPVEWHAQHISADEDLQARGSTQPFEKEYLCKNGTRVPVLVGITLLDDHGVLTVVTDLSERKRVEMALVERVRVAALVADVGMALTADQTLRKILQNCCEAMVTNLGASLARIGTLNGATKVLQLEGSAGMYTQIEGVDSTSDAKFNLALIVGERRPHVTNDLQNDSRAVDPEWARRERMRSFAGYPLLVGGDLVGVMVMYARDPLSDVAIKGLASIADAIAVRIRGKAAEQANIALEEQLRQSQKMEAVGRLAGGVAHDFNNLLSVVLSYSEMVISDLKTGDPIRGDVEEIYRAGVRAAELTRQLLMFSRQQVIETKVVNLNDLLSGMGKMLGRLVGEDVELTSVPGAALGRVQVDPGSIEQVIMNLAINARDAMPIGGKLTMETANVVLDEEYAGSHLGAKPGSYVMLSVTDTGTGMDKATMAQIFEPFFTTKEKGKGTGLGLSTVFGILQQSGGSIWVYSEPGLGTTFKIYLPRVDAKAEDSRAPKTPTTLRGSETILLVEDEAQVRDVARGILRRHGYKILEALNAGEALLLCERHVGPIHLLLTDVVMPQWSGPELAKRLVQVRPDMKVLCMSGYTDDAAVRHGVIDAAFAYLQKPITVEGLTRKVRDVLDSKRHAG